MSKFLLLTVCAFGLLLSSALAPANTASAQSVSMGASGPFYGPPNMTGGVSPPDPSPRKAPGCREPAWSAAGGCSHANTQAKTKQQSKPRR